MEGEHPGGGWREDRPSVRAPPMRRLLASMDGTRARVRVRFDRKNNSHIGRCLGSNRGKVEVRDHCALFERGFCHLPGILVA